jgi:hypothetical protein
MTEKVTRFDYHVGIMLNEAQHDGLQAAANRLTNGNVSSLVRKIIDSYLTTGTAEPARTMGANP